MNPAQYLRCRVGHEWYGIPVENVIEVLQFVALNEVPGAKPDVLGLLTLRNTVMPVIDLRIRFGTADPGFGLETPIVALETSNGPVGIVVDDVDDVQGVAEMEDVQVEASPHTAGIARLNGQLLLLLDISRLRDTAHHTA